ncbi:DUF4190 domain-containing protein [Streptomyces iconiensis]|uniref:DUF4190 domain-containing protein n=1 Tax=Streptomyces iconiensis TaxID=1384038 RepID=A0ABT6ZU39_9ACTN|nr:DUF4190 domain-containing protein [Streptomyces iconiensis]MDJ1132587.1 DUF4190 domain-containing protein [Streptomyces iconiensis]
MDDGAGHPPPSGTPGRAGDQQGNPWAAPQADGAGGAGTEGPPPIPPAPEGPRQTYGQQGGYGYGQAPGAAPGAYGAQAGYAAYGGGAYGPYGYGWQGPPLPAGLSIAAMVLGIVSVVLVATCWGSFLSVITSIVALCLAVSARRKVARGELGGRGQATAGFVLGIVGLVGSVVISTLLVLGLTVWSDSGGRDSGGVRDSYDANGAVAALRLDA